MRKKCDRKHIVICTVCGDNRCSCTECTHNIPKGIPHIHPIGQGATEDAKLKSRFTPAEYSTLVKKKKWTPPAA